MSGARLDELAQMKKRRTQEEEGREGDIRRADMSICQGEQREVCRAAVKATHGYN